MNGRQHICKANPGRLRAIGAIEYLEPRIPGMRSLAFLVPSVLLLLSCQQNAPATRQESMPSAVDVLVATEVNFSEKAKQENTRAAFLANMSARSMVFSNGSAVSGVDLWRSRKPDSSLLIWWPTFAGMSRSELIGFTSGPWHWYPDRRDGDDQGHGQFVTVWETRKGEDWKFVVDLGISFSGKEDETHHVNVFENKAIHECVDLDLARRQFLERDSLYNLSLALELRTYLPDAFVDDGRLMRNGQPPCMGKKAISANREKTLVKYTALRQGGAPSTSQDIGYTFGKVALQFSDASGERPAGYLRIWVNDNGTWKLLIDLLQV